MVSYHSLMHSDLEPLREAVQKWRNVPRNYREVRTEFSRQVERGLWVSDMEGEAADAAFQKMRKVDTQLTEVIGEADDTWVFLDSAYHSLKKWRDKLKARVKMVDEDKHLEIDHRGTVHYKPKNLKSLDADEVGIQAKNYRDAVETHNRLINEALEGATAADTTLHWALSNDHNGRAKGFDSDGVTSMSEANRERQQARKDADALVRLASSYENGERPSAETVRKMADKLAQREGDPYFAERFATRLNAKGTLEFWERVAGTSKPGKERFEATKDFQKSLSMTLATASHSDSRAMKKWKEDALRLGPERFANTHRGIGPGDSPTRAGNPQSNYGFQLMSSLMRSGEWDKDFLVDYGKGDKEKDLKGLIDFERSHDGEPQELWAGERPDEYDAFLNYGKGSDEGMDPMAGYMEALGHNPEAAQEVFHSNEKDYDGSYKPSSDLDYLLRKREWPTGGPGLDNDRAYGYDEMGHALEAATLGRPWDAPEEGLNRSADSANVMSQVVGTVSDHPGVVDDKPGIGNSMAKMGAGYIDDLSWASSNFGNVDGDQALRDAAFGHVGPGHIDVSDGDARAFLRETGSKPGGYEILSSAQDQYVVSAMKAHPEANEELRTILEAGATNQGVLDQARASEIQSGVDGKSTDLRAELTQAAAWKKYAVNQGLGLGTGLVELPLGGDGVKAGTSFGVPLVSGAASGALETHVNNQIDQQVLAQWKEESQQYSRDGIKDKDEFLGMSQKRVANWLETYDASHDVDRDWYRDTRRWVRESYTSGDTLGDQSDGD
ncbi:hypothetical protein [Streptomyces iconiensis]|uniref:AG2 protein n=1 Tax=Streptomyces iconiensis TaxID=1384038 RepID=A0ABT7A528_9ACTN|nr:hypothetical protein [Streptomyces iconiensis]MDJ1136459.1 hypothetical protein [Streptomyces iconiensis]